MKIWLICAVQMFFTVAISAQNSILWSDSIVVVSSSNPITAPRIMLTPMGMPLVTWGSSGDFGNDASQIWCSRFENGAFTLPTGVVTPPDVPLLYGFGGYDLAIADSLVFVVFEQQQQGIFLARSDDGGLTFGPPVSVQGPVAGGYVLLPALTVDGTGNPVIGYIEYKNGMATYQVRRSPDGGYNFDDSVMGNAAAPGGTVCECCTSDLLASGDSLWLLFRNNNQNLRDIWVSRSTDLASSFEVATDVDTSDWQLNFCPISGPRMARAGDSLYTVWMSGASGQSRISLSTLHAGTMQFGQQLEFDTPSGAQTTQSQADITAAGDTIGMVLVENGTEIVCFFSTKGANGLNTQNSRFSVVDHTLQLPSIDYRNGVFHLVYSDATSRQVLYRQGRLLGGSPAKEPIKSITIKTFPNPTHETVILEGLNREASDFKLMNAQGEHFPVAGMVDANHQVSVDLSQYPAGVYYLFAKVREHWEIGKIVKF